MTQHGARAERFRDTLDPKFCDHEHSVAHLGEYLCDTVGKTEAQQALLNRAYRVYLAYYKTCKKLDAALVEIIAHERHHEGGDK